MSHVQEALTGIDTVFHTAGVFSHNVNVTDKLMWDVNVTGTETIVKVCQEKSIRKLIFTSTCIVTMGKDDAIAEGWDEKHPYPREPVNGYVKSKIAAEAIVLAANSVTPSGEGLATCVMRPGGMFGIGDNMLADMALQGRDNYYIGDGTARFDLVHVNAVAYGHICAANHLSPVNDKIPIAAGKVYNLTAGKPVMYKEFFGGLCDGPKSFWGHAKPKSIPVWLASALATINEVTYRSLGIILFAKSFTRLSVEMTQRSYWFNNERAMQDLGYTPLLKWRDHIDLLVQDYSFSCSTAPRLRRRSVPCLSSPHISSRGSIADHRGAT
ncbi:uncharacterized protein LOC134181668 isoform X2 [Corticium candelabrum]|nr:uncharacterized protein LOC134181668 isoform X2 [Corticium candelabrum]XP_062504918.1 uncharacterized protein LOC134181668 isoform X2 [Corticium candelabrum]